MTPETPPSFSRSGRIRVSAGENLKLVDHPGQIALAHGHIPVKSKRPRLVKDASTGLVVTKALQRVRIRSLNAETKLLAEEGGTLSDAEFAEKLGVASRTTIKNYRELNKILAVSKGTRNFCYPAWQIHKKNLLPGLVETLDVLLKTPQDPFAYILFFLTPTEALDNERPLDLLRRNEIAPVITQAEFYGNRK